MAWHDGVIQWHGEPCKRVQQAVRLELDAFLGPDQADGLMSLEDIRRACEGLGFSDDEVHFVFGILDHNGKGKVQRNNLLFLCVVERLTAHAPDRI